MTGEQLTVFATVGTDHHPFDRMVGWMEDLADAFPDVEVAVQYGRSTPPRRIRGDDLLPYRAMQRRLREATVVVTHGGPATIMDARAAGRIPIVVPRDPSLGEHVDDHQVRFSRRLSEVGHILLAEAWSPLVAHVTAALEDPATVVQSAVTHGEAVEALPEFTRLVDRLERSERGRRLARRLLRRTDL